MAAYETLLLCLGAAVIFFVLPTVFLRSLGGKGAPIRQRIVPVKHKIADRFRIDVPDRPGLELSADWTHEKLFQLERRAFFSKNWQSVTHTARFEKPGDYRTFEIAGFSFIVILGKDQVLRAFHNVCRHRAYTITKKEAGSTTVLGCRYHGWSYNTRGELTKAPEFDKVEGFDMEANGLWEIKTEIRQGMIFINFDAAELVEDISVDSLGLLLKNFGKSRDVKVVAEWQVEAAFNWKLAVAEMFPGLEKERAKMPFLSMWSKSEDQSQRICYTTIIRKLVSGTILTIRILPMSPVKTTLECVLYESGSQKSADEVWGLKKAIQKETQRLALQQQANSAKDPFVKTTYENGDIGRMLQEHLKAEQKLGREIHPAARAMSFTSKGKQDDDLCLELEKDSREYLSKCQAHVSGLLDW